MFLLKLPFFKNRKTRPTGNTKPARLEPDICFLVLDKLAEVLASEPLDVLAVDSSDVVAVDTFAVSLDGFLATNNKYVLKRNSA